MNKGIQPRQVCARAALLSVALLLVPALAGAGSVTLFDRTFVRETGQPKTETFEIEAPPGTYDLQIETTGVASALITVNGVTVVAPSDFSANVRRLEREVRLVTRNRVTVELRGDPGDTLRLLFVADDTTPPTITAAVDPPANAAGWHRSDARVTFACADTFGIASCPQPVLVTNEGRGQVITGQAIDRGGNVASVSVTINLDRTPPSIVPSTAPPANGNGWNNTDVTVSFACTDALSGVASCSAPQTVSGEGASQQVQGQVTDAAGNTATASASVSIDRTGPQITATLSAPPNAAGWHNTPVVVTFACDDGSGAGIEQCPAPVTVSGEGAGQVIAGVAVDRAGNSASTSVSVSVDTVAPSVRVILAPAAVDGWHAGDVTVSFECEDGGSGVTVCPAPRVVSSEGAEQPVAVVVTDRGGNTTNAAASVSIDRTAPTIQAVVTPAANALGWHRSPVTVSFACNDALSGVAECPAPVVVDQQGAGNSVSGTVRDRAGNLATTAVTINLDLTPPVIRAIASASGVANGSVTVRFECEDAESGIASCPVPVVLSTEGLDQLVAGEAEDRAGNTARASLTISIDLSKPTIIANVSPASQNGWHNGRVVVTFTCADTGAGVASCSDPVTVETEGAGQEVSGTVRDVAGNEATATVTLNIDRTPPIIRALPSTSDWTRDDVSVLFECEDSLSGIKECPAALAIGAEGERAVTGTATDLAGNTASASAMVRIDRTAPIITATLDREPNQAGWHNTPVTATFTCSDGLSGVVDCPAPATVDSEGAAQALTRTVTDRAGNTATLTRTLKIDMTPPVVEATGASGWTNADAVVTFACSDPLSGVESCPPQQTVSAEGITEVEGTAFDRAGNSTTVRASVSIDRTAPTITAQLSQQPNAAGWHRTPVTVTFTCADERSSVATCPDPITVAVDGEGQIVGGTAIDAAGNRATATVTVNVDTTPPVIQPALSPSAPWTNTDVQVSFACADATSGIASCAAPRVITTEGANQQIEGTAVDQAGNEAVAVATVNIDRTAPTITPTVSPAANAQGWHRGNPTVSFECSDAASGVAECPAPQVVTEDGRNRLVTGSVRDLAGNIATASVTISLDKTAPIVTVSAPSNGTTVKTSPVAVSGTFVDALSGASLVTCDGQAAGLTGGLFACEAALARGAQQITVAAVDAAGNTGTAVVSVTFDPNNAPVARPGGPYNGEADAAISFNGSGSSDPDGQAITYAWDFGDGATSTSASPTHTYAAVGTYTVRLTVRDPDGATHSATTTAAIVRANRAPVASAGGPYTADIGVPVSFDASASSDPDADVLSYAWAFGDGGTATGQRPRRTYLSAGTFTATVTVTDGRGGSHAAQAQVTIRTANQNPIADAGGPYSGAATQAISFSGAGSRDPDDDPLTYTWSFGDGGTGTGRDVTHTYAAAGSFNVSLTVTDTRGGSHSASTTITVTAANATPTAHAGGPYSGRAGRGIGFDGSASSDPDSDVLTYSWSFGDGRSRTGAQPQHAYDTAGTYTVTLTVDDGRGGTSNATASVTVTELTPDDNRAPIADAGGPYAGETGIPVLFSGTGSSDPDGDAVQYSWTFGDGGTSTSAAPLHTFANAGTYPVSLTVSDGRGASHTAVASAVIAPQTDRAPPAVQLSGPLQVLPGTQATITAIATDNVGVASVAFDVDGQISTSTTPPYQRAITIPAVAAPGDSIRVHATARDEAGNNGSATLLLTITAAPDGTAPTVTISAPAETAPGATLRVSAAAMDASGIASVTFRINGQVIPGGAAPYSATYQVPADLAAGSTVNVIVDAIDFAGNRGSAEATVAVAAAGDVTPPTVSVVAPVTSRAGADIALVAQAADLGGIAGVTIVVNGVPVATFGAPPYQTAFRVPANSVPGMHLQVVARAVDFAGLEATAAASVQIVGEGTADGVVTGEVYDDATGLPVAGASVTLIRESGVASATTSDARGRFVLRGASGDALVRITKAGFTTVDRPASFQSGQAVELFDARLTPLGSSTRAVAPVLGGSLEANGVSVSVPAGAVAAMTSLTLTRIGGQGLQGLLPAGWSPVVSFDITPAGTTFAVPAATSAPRNAVAAGTPLVLATWDAQRGGWRAVGTTVAGPGGEALQAPVDASGQFAWLRADAAPVAPAGPVVGELIAGVPLPEVAEGVQATVNPQPKVIFYQPGVRSDVVGTMTLPSATSSGARLWSRLTESYRFFSKAEIHPEPFIQDLVLYQSPDDDRTLMASYPVTPSLVFEALTLERGVISAELIAPPEGAAGVMYVDAAGGQVTLATGERLDIAAGLTVTPVAVRVNPLTATEIGAPVPAGLSLVAAVSVSLAGGTLSNSAVLSIPRPEGLGDSAQVLLTRAETVQGQTKLVLVGLGRIDGDRIVSVAQLPKNKVALEGVRAGGRYVFVRPASPVGFVAGQVLGAQGGAFAGAQVSSDALPIVSLSRAPGGYVAAAKTGTVKLTALDLQKADTGFGQGTLAAAGDEIALDLRLVAQPPRVISVTPAHGARNVAPSDPVVIVFSEPVNPASLTGNVRLAKGGMAVDVTSGLTANNTTLTLRPAQPLAADASYSLTVEKVKDGSGYELASAVTTQFFTLDTTAPAPPAAGSISATIPENGTTTVRGTQGTAAAHDTVTIENLTRGTSTPVLLDPNGGFLVLVQASANDVLKVKIVDPSGNATVVNVPRFTRTNADGSVSATVTADGGRVEGPGGIAVDIDAGTFPAGTTVTIKQVLEAGLPVQLTAVQKELVAFSGGLELDFGGAEPQKYVDVSIPAKPGDTEKDQWMVAQVVTVNGVATFNMVDMAALENGRITTASPPCPGVTGRGVYGIYKSKRDVGLNYGEIHHNDVNGGLRLDVEPMFADVGGFVMPFPVIVMRQRMPVCMPVLSGNVSIEENQLELEIDPAEVTPADRSIVVVNNSVNPAPKYSFPRNILEYAFRVQGREDDPIDVVVEKTDGSQVTLTSQEIASIRKDAGASTVTIRLNMDKLRVTPKKFIIRNKSENPPKETIFEEEVSTIGLRVAGSPGNALVVTTVDAARQERAIEFQVKGSTHPTGNLALRTVSGTIDPTPEQIDEYNSWPECSPTVPYPCRNGAPLNRERGVVQVLLGDADSGPSPQPGGTRCGTIVCLEIPLSSIDRGAVVYPFEGNRTHRYVLHVIYKDGTRDSIAIPGFRLIVTSTQTGKVIRRFIAQAPPRVAPENLGDISDDTVRPVLTEGPARFDAFDPSQPLRFTFSEAIDEVAAKRLLLLDSSNRRIEIETVILSPDGKTVTFVPKESLKLGETYTIDFNQVTDLARNRVLSETITLKTFEPRRLCMNDGGCQAIDTGAMDFTMVRGADSRIRDRNGNVVAGLTLEFEPIADIDFLRDRDEQDRQRTHLVLTLGGYGQTDYRVSTVDVTDPRSPFEEGRDFGGRGKRRVTLIKGLENFRVAPQYVPGMPNSPYVFPQNPADPCHVPNQLFTGNMAVTSSFTAEMSFLTFYNVTNPRLRHPCTLGDKTLTASPFALNDFNRKNTIHASGFARSVAAVRHDAGISIFTAVGEVGVTVTDLAENIPSRFPDSRLKDELYPGDVIDLVPFRDRLLIARRDGPLFEVLDVNLTPIASLDLPQRPVRMVAAEAFQFDANEDGQITQDEVKDLAFLATDTCSWNSGDGRPCQGALQVIDITNLAAPSIIGTFTLPGMVLSLDLDASRQRLVAAAAVWTRLGGGHSLFMIDASNPDELNARDADNDGWDDRIVWRHNYKDARPDALRIDRDRGLAYVGVSYYTSTKKERGALDIWALFDECCDLAVDFTAEADEHETGEDVLDRELRALRAGIKKGLDTATSTCGISTTGLAMLEQGSGACIWRGDCDGTYQPGISDHDYEVFFPQISPDSADATPGAACVIEKLNDVFKDHKPVRFTNRLGREDEMSFDDVTFYPVSMGELTRGRLGIHPPTAAGGSDPGGDLGMGRQQLLLKWLLEGEYVHGVSGYNLKGQNLDWVLQLLRASPVGGSPTGVPLLEGYEWARLMEYNLAKTKAYIRIKGASEATSSFYHLWVKQLHDAGKFGLRAALARMVAVPVENERAIADVSRAVYRSSGGCFDMQPNVPSNAWPGKPCGSFEEYVASAAARSPLFTEQQRQLVARFYRVKSDKETVPNEAAADAFIAATHQFVQTVKNETYAVYAQAIQQDPQVVKRLQNMAALVGGIIEPGGIGGKLGKELRQASLKLAPRFFNQGFRNADEVWTVMYRDVVSPGNAREVKKLRVSLAGGESRFVKKAEDAGAPFATVTEFDRNLNDISDIDVDSKEYHFMLGAGTASNPYVDQSANANQLKNVVFTIDLPSLSGEPGHKVLEAERRNNYNGFHYYILDVSAPGSAPGGEPIPLPLPQAALDPDPACFTEPQIRVLSQNISYATNQLLLNLLNTSNEPLFNVQVCSDLAGRCEPFGTVQAQQVFNATIAFNPPSQAGTYGSNVTVYARTLKGQNIALRWNNTITSPGAPFDVRAYDNTKLNALEHPFSRWTLQHDSMGNEVPLAGVIADGSERAVRIRIEKLRPGVTALIRLLDADTRAFAPGTGHLEHGGTTGSELALMPDGSGAVEIYYTPPAVFVRPGMAHQNDDFNRIERGVRISVVQDQVGVTNTDLALRRPPVFLAHGLFGDIHVWKDFSPLVPEVPAQYYIPRAGFDGRFDLFVVGAPHASDRFAVGAQQVKADIGYSLQNYLPRYAIGKVDLVGHSMGGVLARKLTNDDAQVREAVRKLILINSPQGGSPVADRIVEARDKLPLKVEGLPGQDPPDPNADTKAALDLLDLDPDKVKSVNPVKVKIEWCSALLNSLGRSGLLNVHNGGVDDLQTVLMKDGVQTEIGRIVFGEWEVPTHHIVTTTTHNDLGFSFEVSGLWSGLGLMCNMTPDETTIEKTKLLKIGAEAVKTIAPLFKGASATRTLHKRPFGSLESKKILVDTFKGTLKKGLEELFIGEDPTIVFTTSNDRVVPVWSQLGDGVDESLPPGPINLGHPAVTEVFGPTDHQAAKITPGIFPLMCTRVDPQSGLISFRENIEDLNGDGQPDPTCRVMGLLEADPTSTTFIKTGGQQ